MSEPKKARGNTWCAGCLTDHLFSAGKARARKILIRVVRHDYKVKQDTCRGCGKKRRTIDLTDRKRKAKGPSAA